MWQVKPTGISTNRAEVPACPCICSFGSADVDALALANPGGHCGCQCAYGVENLVNNAQLALSYQPS